MSIFSENLKYLRMQQKLSQVFLAKELEISPSAINMYEKGNREPNFELLKKIAEYFEVDYNVLLGKQIIPEEPGKKEFVYTPNQDIDDLIVREAKVEYLADGSALQISHAQMNDKPDMSKITEYTVNEYEMKMIEFLRNNSTFQDLLWVLNEIDKEELDFFLKLSKKFTKE